jgi:hypothetical protein
MNINIEMYIYIYLFIHITIRALKNYICIHNLYLYTSDYCTSAHQLKIIKTLKDSLTSKSLAVWRNPVKNMLRQKLGKADAGFLHASALALYNLKTS